MRLIRRNTVPSCRRQGCISCQTRKFLASSSKYDSAAYPAVRIMNQLRVNAETSGDYGKAKMMKLRFEEFSKAE